MKRLAPVLLFVAAATIGCRTHPCGDRSADLPSVFGGAPVLSDDGKICDAQKDRATAMYWGDKNRMSEIITATLAKMDGAGWAQYESTNEFAPRRDPERPLYMFRKGEEEIAMTFSPGQTPRLGSKMMADSITINLSHRVLTEKERRKR